MASAVEERPKKRIRISYNDTSETFAIAESVPPEHNLSTIASVFNLSSVGLKVVDNQSSNVALTYDGLDANAEYKISTATPLQAEADFFLVPHHFQFASCMCSFHLTSCFIFHIVKGHCLRR